MLTRHKLCAVIAAAICGTPTTYAQFYNGCSSCGSAPASYVSAATSCTPIQPVQSTCYQTVPVTTYRREQQTVEVPEYRTVYEDREVTEYVPVSRQREIEVPTVSYRTVTENRTVNRDLGRWTTNYHPIAKCAPCQRDPRPGLIGWMNRNMQAMRNRATPNYRTTRQYTPRMVTCNVPVSRQVAVRGTKKVTVNETRMVAKTRTERVAVQKMEMRKRVVSVLKPQVAYQTVPMGSSVAYGGFGNTLAYGGGFYPGSQIAFIDDEDSDSSRTARGPERDEDLESRRRSTFREDDQKEFSRRADDSIRKSGLRREVEPNTAPRPEPNFNDPTPDFPDFGSGVDRRNYSQRDPDYVTVNRPTRRRRGWQASGSQTDQATADRRKVDLPGLTLNDR